MKTSDLEYHKLMELMSDMKLAEKKVEISNAVSRIQQIIEDNRAESQRIGALVSALDTPDFMARKEADDDAIRIERRASK